MLRPAGEWASGYPIGLRELVRAEIGSGLAELAPATGPHSAFRAFRGYFGAVPGAALRRDSDAVRAAVAAARAFAADRDPGAGIVPLAEVASERLTPGLLEASIDAVGPAVGLLANAAELAGDAALAALAAHHVRWHLRTLVRPDGSVAQYALLDPTDGRLVEVRTGPQGLAAGSTWARAQSWGLYAAAQAAHHLPQQRAQMLALAARCADWWLTHLPLDGVPRWDFAAPDDDPIDTSAAAITADALLRLAALEPGSDRGRRHREAAEMTVDTLLPYVTAGGDGRPAGMLTGGCYHFGAHLAVANELVWGDYHLLAALLTIAGELDPLAF
jgi:unsaturated chondroitin disaccharide hydrolase